LVRIKLHRDIRRNVGDRIASVHLWELSRARPLIDLHMLTSRQFGTCFLVMLGTGALLIATTQALPQLLQDQYGYTATWAGLAISPDGAVTMGMMLIVGRLGDVQPRYLIAAGSIIAGFAMIDLLRMTPDADFWFFTWSRNYLGVGLPLIFIPITTASYEGLPSSKTDQTSALINLARNFGGAIGVSLSQTVLARREQFIRNGCPRMSDRGILFITIGSTRLKRISERTRSSEVLPAQAWRMSGRWSIRKRRFLLMPTSSLRSR